MKYFLTICALVSTVGCADLLGKLRKDLDDNPEDSGPTVGGVWPEGGLLEQPYGSPQSVGHTDSRLNPYREPQTWVNPEENPNRGYSGPSFYSQPNLPPSTRRDYRATREDFVDSRQDAGSLWASDGQTNYYFIKNRIRDVGDIVTMKIEDPFLTDIGAELKKNLSPNERDVELDAAQLRLAEDAQKKGGGRSTASAGADKKGAKKEEKVEVREATYADIDVVPSMALKSGEPMMLEIIERYANGHYKVRGTKRIPYRGTVRTLALVGVAKTADITDQDEIPSGKLYEYRLNMYR